MKPSLLSSSMAFLLLAGAGTAMGQAQIQQFDYGDAPAPYPTLLKDNGARHRIITGLSLGNRIDAELDGKPSADAQGDDSNPPGGTDDEDGVNFTSPLSAGSNATVKVTITGQGFLNAWVDFNGNGSWESAEQIFSSVLLGPGPHDLVFSVPTGAKSGPTFARFRLSQQPELSPVGPAEDGEVEDYLVNIQGQLFDFGDAPELQDGLGFPTTLARNGAWHQIVKGFQLGAFIDGESDGQPNATATGDDGAGGPDDEDGVTFLGSLIPGLSAQVQITASSSGRIDAWIDFNRNLRWTEANERIFTAQPVVAGVNLLTFPVPAAAQPGLAFARFRLSREGHLNFDGPGGPGEVEDLSVNIERPASCDQNCLGRDFWVTFPGNYAPDPGNAVKPRLMLVGNAGTVVSVSIPGLAVPFNANIPIPGAGFVEVNLPTEADLGKSNDSIEKKGIHVTSTEPISLHGLSKVQFSSDGFMALPTEALGTVYYVLGWGNTLSGVPELNGSQFAIVATEAATTVTITPTITSGGRTSGIPYSITLEPGQTYQLRGTNGPPNDVTGSHIISDKPIAVFGGHSCGNINSSSEFFCDYLVEEIPPVPRWVTEFYARRLSPRSGGDTFRVLASQNNTIISFNGVPNPPLAAGEFLDKIRPPSPLGTATRITANHPVLVAQYANSSDFDAVVNSDPFMTLLPGLGHFSPQVRFALPAGFASHQINVIAPTAAAAAVQFDGAPMGGFAAIGGTAFSEATKTVSPGVHTVSSPQPVGVNIYGWNQYESYGWPACFFFGDTTPPIVTCPPPVTVILGEIGFSTVGNFNPCQAPVPDFRPKVTSVDNCPRSPNFSNTGNGAATQDPPPGTLVGPGDHTVTISVSDGRGNIGTCTTTFSVLDLSSNPNSQPSIHCPSDMVVKCTEPDGAIVNYNAFGLTGCEQTAIECTPPPGSFFPLGTTIVTCVMPSGGNSDAPPLSCTFKVTVTCNEIGLTLSGSQLTVSWSGGTTLQSAPSLEGPWTDVLEGGGTLTIDTSESQLRFYRIH